MSNLCSICGAELPPSRTCQQVCDELYAYTLSLSDREFIHQHVVDAYAAQHVTAANKPIAIAASLIGLFLFVEQGYTGHQVQQVHMALGNKMKTWPPLETPRECASLTVVNPLSAAPGPQRDEAIKQWARAVWAMWEGRHGDVKRLYGSL